MTIQTKTLNPSHLLRVKNFDFWPKNRASHYIPLVIEPIEPKKINVLIIGNEIKFIIRREQL